MNAYIRHCLNFALNAVFPWQCVSCDNLSSEAVCQPCLKQLQPAKGRCYMCLEPSLLGLTHPKCIRPLGLDGVLAAFDYNQANLDKMITAGKYHFHSSIFEQLGIALAEWLGSNNLLTKFENAILVPLPLHHRRQLWRGFNQAEILSKKIAETNHLPIFPILQKKRKTDTQKDLSGAARQNNLRSAFKYNPNLLPWYAFLFEDYPKRTIPPPKTTTVLLVDDVVTTGATLREACRTLKRVGFSEVWGLTLARD